MKPRFLDYINSDDKDIIWGYLKEESLNDKSKLDFIRSLPPDIKKQCYTYFKSTKILDRKLRTISKKHYKLLDKIFCNSAWSSAQKKLCIRKITPKSYWEDILRLFKRWEIFNSQGGSISNYSRDEETLRSAIHALKPSFDDLRQAKWRDLVIEILSEDGYAAHEKQTLLKGVVEGSDLRVCLRIQQTMEREKDLLRKLPDEFQRQVAATVRESRYTVDEMRNVLRSFIPSAYRQPCIAFLKNMDTSSRPVVREQRLARKLEIFAKLPSETVILVLGATGVGKSTFINNFANFLSYLDLEEAHENGARVLIKTSFRYQPDRTKLEQIEVICESEDGNDENENTEIGESKTLKPVTYTFTVKVNSVVKRIRLIDTPGIGDTGGIIKDRDNMPKIIEQLSEFEEFHAVLVLVKANESRLSPSLVYGMSELFCHLDKVIMQNVIFCFTNTRQTNFDPGTSLETLQAYLKDLNSAEKIAVNITSSFCFDSEGFRYLCIAKNGIFCSNEDFLYYQESWDHSYDEALRLLERISQRRVQKVNSTLKLNNHRNVFFELLRELETLEKEKSRIEDEMKELEKEENDRIENFSKIDNRLLSELTRWVARTAISGKRHTICTAENCPSKLDFCHRFCKCMNNDQELPINMVNVAQIQRCIVLDNKDVRCEACHCSWNLHKQIKPDRKNELNERMSMMMFSSDLAAQIEDTLDKMRYRRYHDNEILINDLEEMIKFAKEIVANLGQCICENALVPYNTHLEKFLQMEIKSEENDLKQNSREKIAKLKLICNEHENALKFLRREEKTNINNNVNDGTYLIREFLLDTRKSFRLEETLKNMKLYDSRVDQLRMSTKKDPNNMKASHPH